MKKLLVLSLAFVLIISALLLLAGCKKECDHSYEKTVTPPTCTEAGEEKFSCTKCDHFYTAEIEATGHTGGTPVEENGVFSCVAESKYDSVVYCTVCDEELSRETVTVTEKIHDVQNGVCTVCGGRESTPGLKYSQKADGTYTVTGIGTCTETNIVIGIYNNRDVTTIGYSAFSGCYSLTSIELPDSLTTIVNGAFYNCSLTSIVIPEGVTTIGYGAFRECPSLTIYCEVAEKPDGWNDSWNQSGCRVAWGCQVTGDGFVYETTNNSVSIQGYIGLDNNVVIPTVIDGKNVTAIGDKAFSYCTSLTNIVIPKGVTAIGDSAFSWCTSLKSIELPDSLTTIGGNAFYCCSSLTSILIPEGVTTIGNLAFSSCDSLTSIELPDSLTTIGNAAFSNCTSLTSIELPDSLITIAAQAFFYCTSLTSIVIPEGVTAIGGYAFRNCTSLKSIELPNGLTTIGDYAFYNCTRLTSIELPDSLTTIGDYAFENCTRLTSIELPDSLTAIGNEAFGNCTSLTSIEIPKGVTTIGNEAFSDCTSLTSITVAEGNENFKSIDGNLYSKDGKTLIQYAIGKTATTFTVPEGVTTIGCNAFECCTSLTSIVIHEGVTTIGNWAFYGCYRLTIYCEVAEKPSGWDYYWNPSNRPVVWGYTGE